MILNDFHNEEIHSIKPNLNAISGSERELMKNSILGADNHGSAKMYREKTVAEGFSLEKLPSNDVFVSYFFKKFQEKSDFQNHFNIANFREEMKITIHTFLHKLINYMKFKK